MDERGREEERDRRARQRLLFLLNVGSLCLFAQFVIQLLPVLIESKPMQPAWQGLFVETLVRNGLLAFLGFILLHFAVYLNPRKAGLRNRLRQVRHLALIATIGFLLLIPLQLASSLQALRIVQAKSNDNAAEVTRLMQVRESIVRAKSPQELHSRLLALTDPGLSTEQRQMKLANLQRDLLAVNDARQQDLAAVIRNQETEVSPLTLLIARVAGAVGWATAFAAGAVPWGSKKALLERFQRRSEA